MIDAILGDIWGYVILAVGAIGGLIAMWFKAESSGKRKEREKQRERADEARKKMDKVDDRSSDDTDDSLSDGSF